MIAIRSTQKLATSNSNGLCDVARHLSKFQFDLENNKVTTNVQDFLFQEQEIQKDGVTITERKIIETRIGKSFNYSFNEIDGFFQMVGSNITKESGFVPGLINNLSTVLIAETSLFKRQTMTEWILDTDHVIVSKFTEIA